MSTICPHCGNEEPEGARFCGSCGAPFATAEQQPADADIASETMVSCPSCGNDEPEGSQFCGSCGTPLAGSEPAVAPGELAIQPMTEEPILIEAPPGPSSGRNRHRWVAAGAVVVLLVAGGALTAVLLWDEGPPVALTTDQQPPTTDTSEPPPPSSPTLAEAVTPHLELLSDSQAALIAQVRLLGPGVTSLAALRQEADALASDVVAAQQLLDELAPGDSTEADALALLRPALAAHLAYAQAISGFPAVPRSLTRAQAQGAIALAEQARHAYVSLTSAYPALPVVYMSGSDNSALLGVVPERKPTPTPPTRRAIDLVPLLVGVRPDDPLGEGRCFGPYTSRASLRVSGVVHRSGFVQCGDDANGDPGRATGVYRFSGMTFPAGSSLARVTGRVAIDESSSSSQRGSSVTWMVLYDGTPICSVTAVWSGSRPSPRELDCRVQSSVSAGGFDVGRLRIQQVATLASTSSFWAGLLDPTIVVEVPR